MTDEFQRICSNCGTANPMSRTTCSKCGTKLVNLPARRGETNVSPAPTPTATSLLVGASVVIAKAGFDLFRRAVLPAAWRAVNRALETPPARSETVEVKRPRPTEAGEEPDVVIRGWRTWSVHRGSDQSSGSEQFEWKINRKNRGH